MKILLAGFNTRAFAESAVGAGFDLESVDCFGDLDHEMLCRVHPVSRNVAGISSMEAVKDKVLNLLDSGSYDCFCYTSGFENHPAYLTEIQNKGVRLLGNPFETVTEARKVLEVGRMLRENGFFAPAATCGGAMIAGEAAADSTVVAHGAATANGTGVDAARETAKITVNDVAKDTGKEASGQKDTEGPGSGKPRRQWLKKPLGGGGGRDIEFLSHPGKQTGQLPEGFFAQEYISGTSCSFAFLAAGGKCRLLGVTEQLTGTDSYNGREFGYAGNIFPLDLPAERTDKMLDELESMASWLTEKFKLVGLNGVDFIYDKGKCWFIEINPRYTASMELMEMAGGLSMAKLHFHASEGVMSSADNVGNIGRAIIPNAFYGKKIVYTNRDVQVVYPETANIKWIRKLYNLGIRDMPHNKEIIREGGPIATVVARGKSRSECMHKLRELSLLVRGYAKTLCV
ncbi:MAG TPA: ATP-grasp domain-containing protein [Clostridia bacterium]|nr:ATP-grasp domain-containing protein [Clostridia bacterium]